MPAVCLLRVRMLLSQQESKGTWGSWVVVSRVTSTLRKVNRVMNTIK